MHTFKIKIKGIVQGVGFRPFVYNLALKYKIKGYVNNDDTGVNILIICPKDTLNKFLYELKNHNLKLARIDSLKYESIKIKKEYKDFQITKSFSSNKSKSVVIPPDMSICDECIEDINDVNNPRYNYTLTNCINCGPRYSIINNVPYDRINTSMKDFILCEFCNSEYTNIQNRRYHAQPVACEKCGPQVSLYNINEEKLSTSIDAIKQAAKLINDGFILAIKGMGGFHLVCDANNEKTINELRLRKNRKNKPFAVMFKDLKQIKTYTNLKNEEEQILEEKEKAILLVKKVKEFSLASNLAPNIDRLGCFIAYTPLHHLLFRYLNNPIIATSANLKDEPIIISKEKVFKKLNFVVDYVLDFNREIINACDDSIIQSVNRSFTTLRLARGFAPYTLNLKNKTPKTILALGANQKSTISIAYEDKLVCSAHIGELNSLESVEYLKRTIDTFKRLYNLEFTHLVCDKHPSYESTKLALQMKEENKALKLTQIQHHYAHALSCMAEYNLDEKVLAFCFDGTGYGDDETIWGGEVFLCDKKDYKREYSLSNFKLLGGEKAVKEPKRIALAILFENYTLDKVLCMNNTITKCFKENEIKLLHKMWKNNLNSPKTSSFGRFFDAVACFASLLEVQEFEGETGLLIEKNYCKNIKDTYTYTLKDSKIDYFSMIEELLEDKDIKFICSKFINTIVKIIKEISVKYKEFPIVLTGGVFQNKTLLELVLKILENRKVYFSKNIPLNDGGISVGQAYYLS